MNQNFKCLKIKEVEFDVNIAFLPTLKAMITIYKLQLTVFFFLFLKQLQLKNNNNFIRKNYKEQHYA